MPCDELEVEMLRARKLQPANSTEPTCGTLSRGGTGRARGPGEDLGTTGPVISGGQARRGLSMEKGGTTGPKRPKKNKAVRGASARRTSVSSEEQSRTANRSDANVAKSSGSERRSPEIRAAGHKRLARRRDSNCDVHLKLELNRKQQRQRRRALASRE